MMMKALEAGGMTAVYSRDRDERMYTLWGEPDYTPNDQYYELDSGDYRDERFPLQYEGKLIKCLSGGMYRLNPAAQYRIVFMRRDTIEISRSMAAAFQRGSDMGTVATDSSLFQAGLDRLCAILADRRSVTSITQVHYDAVVADPLPAFELLRSHGWPIDPAVCARVPSPDKKRFTNERAGRAPHASVENL